MGDPEFGRLSRELDTLFELSGQARSARLVALRAEDPAFADELERILAADADSGLLDAGIASAAPTMMSRLAAADDGTTLAATEAGRRIDHYRLVERIGSGGMGEVWRAERVDDFQQEVAVKLIRPLLDSPQLRERFARERQILARLDHPNIARLLDGGVAEDGTPWFAMEFVRGDSITAFADAQQLGTRARVELLLQVCDAVAHAQSQLVIHRDLKPSNVLVGSDGRARVLDFGIARLIDEAADVRLTGTGVRVFSPAYAAPEQVRGDAVGTAADVYALGAVLFELLTGRPPHPGRSAAPERLLSQITDEGAPRPSDALREHSTSRGAHSTATARELAGDLDTIVATALQPEPARRYVGAAQLADDLRRWLDGHPIAARPDTAGYRMRKFVARHRIAVASAGAVLLALVAGLGIALWQASVARQHAARADAEARRANAQALLVQTEAAKVKAHVARVRKVKEFMVSVFVQSDPRRRVSQGPVTIEEAFDAALERARAELTNDPVLQADVFDDFGEIRTNQGRFDEAMALFRQALAVAEKEYGPDHPAVAETLANIAAAYAYGGDMGQAMPHLERAVAILEKDDGGDPVVLANVLGSRAALRQAQGDLDGTRRDGERAVQLLRERAPNDPLMVPALTNLGMIHINQYRMKEGEAILREAMARNEAEFGTTSVNLWPILVTLASISFQEGDGEEEARLTQRALDIARAAFPDAHPWTAGSLVERGLQIARSGDSKRGEALLDEGVAMYEALDSPDVASALRRKAIVQRLRGDSEGALRSLQRAWETCSVGAGAEGQICLVVRANRASVLARIGRGEEALREADAALAALDAFPKLVGERTQAIEARAAALSALGRHDEALAVQDAAIALLGDIYGADHGETRRARATRDRMEKAGAAAK